MPAQLAAWIGERVARDLAEQAARTPADAARAAGCASADEISAWASVHRTRRTADAARSADAAAGRAPHR